MKRMQFWGTSAVLLGLTFGVFGCGQTEEAQPEKQVEKTPAKPREPSPTDGEDLSTPEKTIQAAKVAAMAKDYPKFFAAFTRDAQQTMTGLFVIFGIEMQAEIAQQETDGTKLSDAEVQFDEAINKLFQKHNLLGNESAKTEIQLTAGTTETDRGAQIRELVKPIPDHKQFIADFVKTMSEFGGQTDPRLVEEDAHLENIEFNEEKTKATADFVQNRNGKERRSPVEFELVYDQWKLSKVPDLLH